jgi:uncharacterized RDD family membrane protein YckC
MDMDIDKTKLASLANRFGCSLLGFILRPITFQIGYLIWSIVLWQKGDTPNKKIVGLKIISSETLKPISAKHLALRQIGIPLAFPLVALLNVAIALLLNLGPLFSQIIGASIFMIWIADKLWIFKGDKKQRLTDVWCKTYVINVSELESVGEVSQLDKQASAKKQKFTGKTWAQMFIALVSIILVITAVANKNSIPYVNGCMQLKTQLDKQDEIGYRLWEEYQREVSSIAAIPINQQYLAIKNINRRVVQVLTSDLAGYELMEKKPHCSISDFSAATYVDNTKEIISYLEGRTLREGAYWSEFNGWNSNYYSKYFPFSDYLK